MKYRPEATLKTMVGTYVWFEAFGKIHHMPLYLHNNKVYLDWCGGVRASTVKISYAKPVL